MIIEADKSQDRQGESAGWRPWRADCVALVPRSAGLRPRKGQCFSLSQKAGKSTCPDFNAVRQEEVSPCCCRRSSSHSFVLFELSPGWVRPGHVREGSLLHSGYPRKCYSCPESSQKHPEQCLTTSLGTP